MSLQYVTLTLDLSDGSGEPVRGGRVLISPSAAVSGGGILVASQLSVDIPPDGSRAVVPLLATDNEGLVPAGWSWQIIYLDPDGRAIGTLAWMFRLDYASGAGQDLSACHADTAQAAKF